jgi:hypothetical protein
MIYVGRSFRQQQKFKQGPGRRPPRASQVHFWQCSGVCVCVCMYIYILRTTTGTPLEPLKYTSDSAQVCVCVCVLCTYMWTHRIFFYFKRMGSPFVTPPCYALNLGQTVKNRQLYSHFAKKKIKILYMEQDNYKISWYKIKNVTIIPDVISTRRCEEVRQILQ